VAARVTARRVNGKIRSALTRREFESCTRAESAGVDVPSLSVLTPYRGTPAYSKLEEEGRILSGRGWEFYNRYNLAFQPRGISPDQLLDAHALWLEAFSLKYSLLRVLKSLAGSLFGALLMCLEMNCFYCLKRLRGNEPIAFDRPPRGNPRL
jgi:hypothetical protein